MLDNILDKNTKLISKLSTQLGGDNAQNYNTSKVAYYRDRGYSNIVEWCLGYQSKIRIIKHSRSLIY